MTHNALSFSDISTYQRCPLSFYYRRILRIERKKKSLALVSGTNAHEILKAVFTRMKEGMDINDAWADTQEYVHQLYEESSKVLFAEEQVDAKEELDLIVGVIDRYIQQFNSDWEILHVEEEFYVVLDSGDVISFTPDLVVRDRAGSVWIVDHKTTSQPVEAGIPFGDLQSYLYFTGVKAVYPKTVGFVFSRMRKKLPTQPRLTKTGKKRVADLARIDTTYEVLRDFLLNEAPDLLDDEAHKERLAQLRDEPDKFFWSEGVYANEAAVSATIKDVQNTVLHIKLDMESGVWARHLFESRGYKDCRKCQYQPICQASMLGWDIQYILQEEYETR